MYVILDNTFATLGDLIGFDGYLNTSAPFTLKEHHVQYKTDRQYWDFSFGNTYNKTCNYPAFWNETGFPIDQSIVDRMQGCYDSEFDQYGDTEAFGVYPDFRREITKFASVQDRLREWHAPVRAKIEHFYCMLLAQLDFDGYRYDKATQSTVDAMGFMNEAMRTCARRFGKNNFFLPGEITGGNTFGSIFVGRGRQPDMLPPDVTTAITLTPNISDQYSLRSPEHSALDAAAFHYTVYRTLTRFLGMDGNLAAGYDAPLNWIDQWNTFLLTNDLVNQNTGHFDPRHMYGVTNQDVFRWPAITNGIHRQLLGHFVTTLLMPGIPLLLYGEEQAFYILDNINSNYIFGRQAMSSATAWKTHGCYGLDSTQYYEMPLDSCKHGCNDDSVAYDHRDPSAPVRNILHHMYYLREHFPILQDGFYLQQLSNQTENVYYPGSSGVATETGMWSVMRSIFYGADHIRGDAADHTPVWLLYSNLNESKRYEFNCRDNSSGLNIEALISPYDGGTLVKNLFYPYDEVLLGVSELTLGIDGSVERNGCLDYLDMVAYDFRAYVPYKKWVGPLPMITAFLPGHDARLISTVGPGDVENIEIGFEFSVDMDCDSITKSLSFQSTTVIGNKPSIDPHSILCGPLRAQRDSSRLVGEIESVWTWKATLNGVANGVHRVTVDNPNAIHGQKSTRSRDHFLFRVGQIDNPIVFPGYANYSSTLLVQGHDGKLLLNQSAAGADLFRYSTNWESSFSEWVPYDGGFHEIHKQAWTGTSLQSWKGEHVRVEYYSRFAGTSDHVQEADLGSKARRFPHLFLQGPYNAYGYDAGLDNQLTLVDDHTWAKDWMVEWSANGTVAQVNVWGMNPDGFPDATVVMGDVDGDSVLDRLPPSALAPVSLNLTAPPPKPFISWRLVLDDGNLRFAWIPAGSMWTQLALYVLLWTLPVIAAAFSTWAFMQSFYQVKFNEIGIGKRGGIFGMSFKLFQRLKTEDEDEAEEKVGFMDSLKRRTRGIMQKNDVLEIDQKSRRTVLIGTIEYDIEDWEIKVKIGGLGVMAQLMGKNLSHQDLIWVVPCVGGIDYPEDQKADPMIVTIMGTAYHINVQYHTLRNITYVLLDAPIFRQQTKAEPYPARMDDMMSAIYYSAWNQCIAQAITRFPIDLYHINDYHGTIAPLYLLPQTIPVCLSLHNAEFQGLWPMRTKAERDEVCSVYNLPTPVVQQYVQFGEIFNLLHAGASYLRVHQQGFGAVGVSKKYGPRSYARYPIFWGLKRIQALQNPDPSDTGEWDKKLPKESDIKVDEKFEKERLEWRTQAQEWAGLEKDETAELFVFVGRWSMQKGVDLIADVFPALLESNPKVQLICVGPVIDLYGKFAASKFARLMEIYPTRVCSKPVFTAIPPYVFSGAEWALIPSRDEPFGLVAVEFGRKGAIGVGARVGGLGQMPGWWYTVESTSTFHLLKQFKGALNAAMASSYETRAMMRARSAKQRFPVAQWVEDLEILQSSSIRLHNKKRSNRKPPSYNTLLGNPSLPTGVNRPQSSGAVQAANQEHARNLELAYRQLTSLGTALGPGQQTVEDHNDGYQTRSVRSLINMSDGSDIGQTPRATSPTGSDDDEARHFSINVTDAEEHYTTVLARPWRQRYRDDSDADSYHTAFDDDEEDEDDNVSIYESHLPRLAQVARFTMVRPPSQVTRPVSSSTRASQSRADSMALRPSDMPWMLPRAASSGDMTAATTPRLIDAPLPQTHASSSKSVPSTPTTLPNSPTLRSPPRAFSEEYSDKPPAYSMLSVPEVVGAKGDFKLQQVEPFFTDTTGYFHSSFVKGLEDLDGKNSESKHCIEEFLVKSEKTWFNDFRNAKLGRSREKKGRSSEASSLLDGRGGSSRRPSFASDGIELDHEPEADPGSDEDEFLLGKDYRAPTGLRKWMQIRVGDWPLYAYFLALGQIIAANSYQITLLTGEVGQTADKLYVVASIYLGASIMWWLLYRRFESVVTLSVPFLLYGLAFFFVGVAHWASYTGTYWIQNVGTAFYAIASASGFLFFALNFGDEGGAQVSAWVFRACVIQGCQQMYVVLLWYWGSILTKVQVEGRTITKDTIAGTWKITAICWPIAIVLVAISYCMWCGLPNYYRQVPGTMPSFYRSILRRKVIVWFFVTAIVQNFFLSAPYGRNWSFLFSSQHASAWQILLLVIFFFVFVWAAILWLFGRLSKSHTWILPLFAIGLGAPRWAQIWWGTSNIGLWLPWAGGYVSSALVSRALWLWLGVLDSVQGVGLGMIMLGTLTRVHVAFAVTAMQVLGSLATIASRAVGPNRIGPGPISPDISGGLGTLAQAWFWVGLFANLLVCVGFYKFYRKEQLQKP